jgi:hypothetical protein
VPVSAKVAIWLQYALIGGSFWFFTITACERIALLALIFLADDNLRQLMTPSPLFGLFGGWQKMGRIGRVPASPASILPDTSIDGIPA